MIDSHIATPKKEVWLVCIFEQYLAGVEKPLSQADVVALYVIRRVESVSSV